MGETGKQRSNYNTKSFMKEDRGSELSQKRDSKPRFGVQDMQDMSLSLYLKDRQALKKKPLVNKG